MEQLGRLDSTCTEYDLSLGQNGVLGVPTPINHCPCLIVLELNLLYLRISNDMKTGSVAGRFQIRARTATAEPVPCSQLIKAGALLVLAIEIWISRISGLRAGLHEGFRQAIGLFNVANTHGS